MKNNNYTGAESTEERFNKILDSLGESSIEFVDDKSDNEFIVLNNKYIELTFEKEQEFSINFNLNINSSYLMLSFKFIYWSFWLYLFNPYDRFKQR